MPRGPLLLCISAQPTPSAFGWLFISHLLLVINGELGQFALCHQHYMWLSSFFFFMAISFLWPSPCGPFSFPGPPGGGVVLGSGLWGAGISLGGLAVGITPLGPQEQPPTALFLTFIIVVTAHGGVTGIGII